MPSIRSAFIALVPLTLLALPAPASAITLDQAMEQCSKQYGHLYDTNGAPKMAQAIEACANDKVRAGGSAQSSGGKRKKVKE